jgi:hypothetical protein
MEAEELRTPFVVRSSSELRKGVDMSTTRLRQQNNGKEEILKESSTRPELYVRTAPSVKYIIFAVNDLLEAPVIFPSMANHSDVRKAFPDWQPIAAGFYDTQRGCYGLSDSLQLDSRSKDTEIIRRYFNEATNLSSQC